MPIKASFYNLFEYLGFYGHKKSNIKKTKSFLKAKNILLNNQNLVQYSHREKGRKNMKSAGTRRNLHTRIGSFCRAIKQIGTICVSLFFSICAGSVYGETLTVDWLVDGNTYTQTTCETGNDLILPATPTKYGHTFIGWEIQRYTEISYIESTGTQFIRTGVDFMYGDEFFIDYMHTGILSGENKGYGSGGPISGQSVNSTITGGGRQVSDKQQMWVLDSNYAYSPTISLNNLLNIRTTEHWKISTSTRRLNSTLTNTSSGATYTLTSSQISTSYTSNGHVTFFRDNYDPWANPSKMRLYGAWLKRSNGTKVFDLIPVLDINGVPCMYDKVSEEFLYNLGTGTFGYGL